MPGISRCQRQGSYLARATCSSLLTYHTYGGEIREPLAATDADDLNTFKQLTTQGLLQSGYKKVRSGIGGAFLNWAYKQRGIVAYLTEVWNLQQAAGITVGAAGGTGNDGTMAAIGGMNTESESRFSPVSWSSKCFCLQLLV